jgi:hypothetical protein
MSSLFLGCFAFGLIFTVASFLLGALGGSQHLHLPGVHLHIGGGGAGHGGGHGGAHVAGGHATVISPFNLSTISAFLAWFGGTGYLLTRYSSFAASVILGVAGAAGVAGGGIIFLTLSRFVLPRLTEMRPRDYQVQGTMARVSSSIGSGGTGEVVYALGGTQHVDGARSVSGEVLERGTEVVIMRVERGIAWVERWDRFADKNQLPPGDTGAA